LDEAVVAFVYSSSTRPAPPKPDTVTVKILRGPGGVDTKEVTSTNALAKRLRFAPANGNPVLFTDTIPGAIVAGNCRVPSPPSRGKLRGVIVQFNEDACWTLVDYGDWDTPATRTKR
jgi:hypothetical protein